MPSVACAWRKEYLSGRKEEEEEEVYVSVSHLFLSHTSVYITHALSCIHGGRGGHTEEGGMYVLSYVWRVYVKCGCSSRRKEIVCITMCMCPACHLPCCSCIHPLYLLNICSTMYIALYGSCYVTGGRNLGIWPLYASANAHIYHAAMHIAYGTGGWQGYCLPYLLLPAARYCFLPVLPWRRRASLALCNCCVEEEVSLYISLSL